MADLCFSFCSKHPYLVEPLDKTVVLNCHAKLVVLSIAVSQRRWPAYGKGREYPMQCIFLLQFQTFSLVSLSPEKLQNFLEYTVRKIKQSWS